MKIFFLFFCLFISIMFPSIARDEGTSKEKSKDSDQTMKEHENSTDKTIYDHYSSIVTTKLERSWFPPKDGRGNTQVSFKIYKDGNISDLKIIESSDVNNDMSALRAVKAAAPFEPLPKEIESPLEIMFNFGPHLRSNQKNQGFFHYNTK